MRRALNDKVFKLVFIISLAAFCLGVVELMTLRFRMGDVYPAYSSLRSDPIGTKAYLESLNHVGGVSASRNYKYLVQLQDTGNSTIFFFGLRLRALYYMDADQVEVLESLAASGNRVVLLLYPDISNDRFERENKKKGEEKEIEDEAQKEGRTGEAKGGNEEGAEDDEDFFAKTDVSRSLRFSIDMREANMNADIAQQMVSAPTGGREGLPGFLQWHSNVYFKDLGDKWDVVYELEGLPVMIERGFGKGSIVLGTDSYFVSNEAMLNDRHSDLLAWLVGNNRRVVFDETHLGIGESPGIASLMRKYNLHGLLVGLLVLAILFVWKNASSLVPPSATAAATLRASDAQAGKDYSSGVVSLLRRNIPAGQILFTCFEEWKKAFPKKSERSTREMRRVRKVLALERTLKPRNRNPVKAYRDMSEILSERKSI